MPSPYPWHYTLRWPLYFNWPSMRNRSKLQSAPDHYQFCATGNQTLTLLFCGDIMVQNKDIIPVLSPALAQLMQRADLFIGNCEAPVGEHRPNPAIHYRFKFHMPRVNLESIINQSGLSAQHWVLSNANNHSGDVDILAFKNSITILNDMGVTPLGTFNANEIPLTIIEKKNMRLGFIAWTEWMNCEIFSEAEPGAVRRQHILNYDWHKIKISHNLDYLFGVPHWEYEFQHYPHQATRTLAKELIDERGIDFVIGIHTHTLQPMEWFDNGFCFYSLGNFCGLGRAWSIKLIPLLEIKLDVTKKNKIISYQLHYFYQQHTANGIAIIPIKEAPSYEQKRLMDRVAKLYKIS